MDIITNTGAEEAVEDFGLINKIDIGTPKNPKSSTLYLSGMGRIVLVCKCFILF